MNYQHLPSRGIISLSGEDRITFLQGLISNDARKLEKGEALYAALLTPQGKFLHDFFLLPVGEQIWIDCEAARADDLIKRLNLYKLRSKVKLEQLPDKRVVALWNSSSPANIAPVIIQDPRLPQLGFRAIGNAEEIMNECAAHNYQTGDYDRMRLALGVPDGSRDMKVDKSLLLECGFEELHGVDFNKGCYVGQEVTARSKFRAQLRKGFYIVEGAKLPASGEAITVGGIELGEMRSSSGNIGLAILRMEETEQVRDALSQAGIVLTKPSFLIN